MPGMGGDVGGPSTIQDTFTPPIAGGIPRQTTSYQRRAPDVQQAQQLQQLQQRARMMQMLQQLGIGPFGNRQGGNLAGPAGIGQLGGGAGQFSGGLPSAASQIAQLQAATRPQATPIDLPLGGGNFGGGGGGGNLFQQDYRMVPKYPGARLQRPLWTMR